MLSGWSTAGRLACPYCMDKSDAFTLKHSGKQSWFDNHRKFLLANHPFRKNKIAFFKNKAVTTEAPLVRSGYDILAEIETLGLKKVTELDAAEVNALISKTCEKNVFDNVFNTVMDVTGKTKDTYKSREELNDYCQRPELKRNLVTRKFPKACYTLDKPAREALCEWVRNLKFPDGYASNMSRCVDMKKLKLFGMKSHDCHVFMQRLIPIAFRELLPLNVWKFLTELSLFFKNLTSTTIRVEEMTKLENDIPLILCKLERIFPPSFFDSMEHLPIHLAYEARIAGPVQYRWMYPFERVYTEELKRSQPNISNSTIDGKLENEFANWFNDYAHDPSNNISNKFIKDLAKGPQRSVNTYSGYYVNGFKFHTIGYGGTKETMNSGVCIKGINYSIDESDYYGRLVEVVQVEYPSLPVKRTILFKCEWFDPTTVGMKVHSQYKLVEVNHKHRFNRYEPFVLAMQAAQVYYCTYPSLRRDKLDWWAVCKIKARSEVEVPESSISSEESLIPPPFQEEITDNHDLMQIDEDPSHLNDPNGGVIELDG
ncbi:uncharacterized protein LOC116033108 [Ipomoea triloba]|uniref:uncharacterized protein LOC116033108 n=1 Tax=Ipomoea triloba TaxID=35885 RepID=UPI00125DD1DF|nr:uncharacterized protein LOC116033108 [Ipomoea triloba]